MTYFLDFDRTLFDTDAFNRSLVDEPGCAPFKEELKQVVEKDRDVTLTGGFDRIAAWSKVSKVLACGDLSFTPGHLSRFLYSDVAEFLRMLGNEAIVITYGDLTRQKAKIESALAGIVRVTVLYTEDRPKAEYLEFWPGYNGEESIFVDDRVAELEALAAKYPNLRLYEIRRDGGAGDGRWPVIRSLNELP